MSTHRAHPDPNFADGPDNPDAIFFDFCPECNSQAQEPYYLLDQYKMRRLWNRMLNVEVSDSGVYLSHTEAKACKNLWPIYIFVERFTDNDPMTMRVGLPTL